ncbi:MAG: GYD domain-containing protein, partial [Ilumatobacteraceae bacterium]
KDHPDLRRHQPDPTHRDRKEAVQLAFSVHFVLFCVDLFGKYPWRHPELRSVGQMATIRQRKPAASAAFESVGGKLDCMYYAFGDTDVYGTCDLPDVATATAISLMINATGALMINLTPLMTVEDVDAAMANSPSYRPPGG